MYYETQRYSVSNTSQGVVYLCVIQCLTVTAAGSFFFSFSLLSVHHAVADAAEATAAVAETETAAAD